MPHPSAANPFGAPGRVCTFPCGEAAQPAPVRSHSFSLMSRSAYWDTFVLSGTGVNNFDSWVGSTMSKVTPCQKRFGDQLWPPPEANNCDTDTIEGVAAGLYAYQLSEPHRCPLRECACLCVHPCACPPIPSTVVRTVYWLHKFDAKQFFITSLSAYENDPASVIKDASHFIGAGGVVGNPKAATSSVNSVKVMGGMSEWARHELGKFYRRACIRTQTSSPRPRPLVVASHPSADGLILALRPSDVSPQRAAAPPLQQPASRPLQPFPQVPRHPGLEFMSSTVPSVTKAHGTPFWCARGPVPIPVY